LEHPTDSAAQVERAVSGAVGSALGTGVGVAVALVFMAGVYWLNRKLILRRIQRDRHEQVDSYGSIIKMITLVVTPFILSTAVYNLSSTINTKLYTSVYPGMRALDTVAITEKWGIFSGQALTISNIPIAFASAMAAAIIPSVAQLVAAKDLAGARDKIGVAVKTTMVISIPCAVGLFVLAKPVTYLLFPSNSADSLDMAGKLLMTLALSVIFYALSTLNSSILQGLGKVTVGGQEWTARSVAEEGIIPVGTVVVVEEIKGVKLMVRSTPKVVEVADEA
jgi:stage V sporulation protein B